MLGGQTAQLLGGFTRQCAMTAMCILCILCIKICTCITINNAWSHFCCDIVWGIYRARSFEGVTWPNSSIVGGFHPARPLGSTHTWGPNWGTFESGPTFFTPSLWVNVYKLCTLSFTVQTLHLQCD